MNFNEKLPVTVITVKRERFPHHFTTVITFHKPPNEVECSGFEASFQTFGGNINVVLRFNIYTTTLAIMLPVVGEIKRFEIS